MRSRIAVVAAVAVLGWSCEASVEIGSSLDLSALTEDVEAAIPERHGIEVASVTCPEGLSPDAGDVFVCEVTDADGNTADVTVTVDDDEGNVTWVVRLLGANGLEQVEQVITDGIGEQLDVEVVRVECPQDVLLNTGNVFRCTAYDRVDDSVAVRVEMTNSTGSIDWSVVED